MERRERSAVGLRPRASSALGRKQGCATCGKQFNRTDSLKRHLRTHDSGHRHEKTRRRACSSCVRSKAKCSEHHPTCERCEHKDLPCVYTIDSRQSPRTRVNIEDAEQVPPASDSNDADSLTLWFAKDNDANADQSRISRSAVRASTTPWNEEDIVFPVGVDPVQPLAGTDDTGAAASSLLALPFSTSLITDNIPIDPVGSTNSAQCMQGITDVLREPTQEPLWPEDIFSQFIGVGDFYPTFLSPLASDGVSGHDTTHDAATSFHASGAPLDPMTGVTGNPLGSPRWPDVLADSTDVVTDRTLAYPTQALPDQSDHFQNTRHHVPQQQPRDGDEDDIIANNLPQENVASIRARNTRPGLEKTLPELSPGPEWEDAPYPKQFALPVVDQTVHERLRNCLSVPLLGTLWEPISLASFPSGPQIDYLVDLYFTHFDMILPVVHRPTFDPGADPVLTLSMCAIGVFYSGFANARSFGKSLCELLRRLLVLRGEQDVASTRNFGYLAAQTLQSVLGNSCGNNRLFEFSDNNRGPLVANARAIRLFSHREPSKERHSTNLQAQWESWIRTERLRRLAWCIYLFDTSATYYRSCRPHLSLAEMKVSLPCSAECWEAESAAAWASLRPWAWGSPPPNISFRETMDRLFEDHSPPRRSVACDAANNTASAKVVDEFHRILISTTLLRMVWDYRESMKGPRPPFPRIAALDTDAPADQLKILLSLLGELTTSALQVAAKRAYLGAPGPSNAVHGPGLPAPLWHAEREFQGLVHRARVSLVAQIVAADEISDHLDAGWSRHRTDARPTAQEVAERSLRAWADADPVRPRRMARVGAQLLAISRLYPYNLPREPYDAFRAGLLLWTMLPLVRSADPPDHLTRTATETSSLDDTSFATGESSDPHAPEGSRHMASTAAQRRQQESNGGPTPAPARRVCQLDWLGPEDSDEAQTIRDWVQRGGDDFVLRIHGISNACTRQGSRQILQHTSDLLRKLKVWGSSHMYREIILRALREADGD